MSAQIPAMTPHLIQSKWKCESFSGRERFIGSSSIPVLLFYCSPSLTLLQLTPIPTPMLSPTSGSLY